MAIAIMRGLTVATLLTIFFVPALYAAWFRVRREKGRYASGACVRVRALMFKRLARAAPRNVSRPIVTKSRPNADRSPTTRHARRPTLQSGHLLLAFARYWSQDMRTPSSRVLLARQPIFGRNRAIVAYELLYRSPSERERALFIDNALATADVVDAAFRRIGIEAVVGRTRALINVDAEFLLSRRIERLPKESVMLELLETIDIDAQIVRRCRALKERGYQLALDDVCQYSDKFEPLLEFVDVVKIDVMQLDAESLAKLVQQLRAWPARLLAEKVSSASSLKQCLELGFEWVQGFFCARPAVLAA